MKEILAVTTNLLAAWDEQEKRLVPKVELILITSEPNYDLDPETGELERRRVASHTRIIAAPDALRAIASQLVAVAEEAYGMMPACAANDKDLARRAQDSE